MPALSIRLLARATLPMLLAGCGLLSRRSSTAPPDPVVDSRIRVEVEQRIAAEPSLSTGHIRVEVRGATVLLHGSVQGIGAWQCAITTAGLASGVSSVVDYLVLERGPRDVRCLAPRPGGGEVGAARP